MALAWFQAVWSRFWQPPGPVTLDVPSPPSLGTDAISRARFYLTQSATEIPLGSNNGEWVRIFYGNDYRNKWIGKKLGAWCGIFTSHCFEWSAKRAQTTLGLTLRERRSAKGLGKALVKRGATVVTQPRQGDVAVFHRGKQVDGRWTWRGHIAIVDSPVVQGKYWTIDGNVDNRVKRVKRVVSDRKLLHFLRI